ncbi:uncharacterized protein LACBIDRAFT_298336 [Laccaria bicolor S238N-H82]|uniref:Predicted protein n=1 Tax=Laccaria bicolor (strain S238N-H82 / ATCC MYA-4686) TaxID=486041 RepID=B0E3A7_LACBS|nr:uncharacterized protein LACBIDRAFT_298336 [Laccaria bicolor S238N-H82]EDQ98675.1 predicted protein [Laccaria bicolor S238N-H82]|eukprot:XP_001890674.1 predicted protein [Laccaria bicolor S238N-H82]
MTETEVLLLAALQESHKSNEYLTNRNIALQAGNLLNEVYCVKAKGALQFQEEKKKKKKRQGTLPDGLPCVLKGDRFYEERVNFEKERQAEEREKDNRKDLQAEWKAAKEKWQQAEDARKELKEHETAKYEEALAVWKAVNEGQGRGCGCGCGGGNAGQKPVMAAIPKWVPPPLLKDFLTGWTGTGLAEEEEGEHFTSDESNNSNRKGLCLIIRSG